MKDEVAVESIARRFFDGVRGRDGGLCSDENLLVLTGIIIGVDSLAFYRLSAA
jgi:hypothetical protein